MKNHVVSLELAKKLKEKGYPNDIKNENTEYFWEEYPHVSTGEKVVFLTHSEYKGARKSREGVMGLYMGKRGVWDTFSAPLATELLEQLPVDLKISRKAGKFRIWIPKEESSNVLHSKSLPDALAEMWLYLKENNLL